jgi:Membrane-bound toxin component of toxin-antitoxin system
LKWYIIVLHLFLYSALFSMVTGWMQQILVVMLSTCLFCYSYWRYATERPGMWVSRVTFFEKNWSLLLRGGETSVCLQQATVWSWLVVMNFYNEHSRRRYCVILFPDSSDQQQLRRLRAMIRHMPVWSGSLRGS